MKDQMDSVSAVFSSMGAFTKAFGMETLNFGTLTGFYGIECGNILGIGGALFAALLGISALAREEKDGTAELLLTHPLSRAEIVTEKLVAILVQIVAMNIVVFLLAIGSIAMNARQTRSGMLDVIRSDYVTTARAKGVKEHDVIYKPALKNALIPIITLLGSAFGASLGGTVVTETIFTMPGIGLYMTNGINNLDYPIVRSCVVILAIIFSFIMLAVDLIYAMVDPRIKAEYIGK